MFMREEPFDWTDVPKELRAPLRVWIERHVAYQLHPLLELCGVEPDKILFYKWTADQVIDIVLNRVKFLESQLMVQTTQLRKTQMHVEMLKRELKCE